MIIGFSREYQTIVLIYMISSFLFGFIPGFYLPLLFIRKIKKITKSNPLFLGISLISGLIFGYQSYLNIFLNDPSSKLDSFIRFVLYYLPYIVGIEILIIIFHF